MEYLFLWMIFGIGTSIIASNKGYDGCSYFILGVLLGPIGLVIAIFSSAKPKLASQVALKANCNFCGFDTGTEALFCPGCGKDKNGLDQAHYMRMASDSSYKAVFETQKKEKIRKIEQKKIRNNILNTKYTLISFTVISAIVIGYFIFKQLTNHGEKNNDHKVIEYQWNEKGFENRNALKQFIVLYEDLITFKDQSSFQRDGFSVSPYLDWNNALMRLKRDEEKNKYLIDRNINIEELRKMAFEYTKTNGQANKLIKEIRNHFDKTLSMGAPMTIAIIKNGNPEAIKTPDNPKVKRHSYSKCSATFTEGGQKISTKELTLMIKDLGSGNYSVLFFTPNSETWSFTFKFVNQKTFYEYRCTDCGTGQTTTLRSSSKLSEMAMGKGGILYVFVRDRLGTISVTITAK